MMLIIREPTFIRGTCMKIRIFSILLAVMIAMLSGGCYPKRVGPEGADGKKLTWAEMSLAQRKERMRNEVLPRAGAVFRSWKPERFETISCNLCHGKGMETGNFHMPTAHLPRLSGELLLGPEFAKHPDTTKLKLDRLVPTMADILGLKSFSIITRSGFGCYSCHLSPDGPIFGNS